MTALETPMQNEDARRAGPTRSSSESDGFRSAMREFAAGVAIVAAGQGPQRAGCTATSIASLSLEPPTLVLCLAKASATLGAIRSSGAFGVSILNSAAEELAERFAGRTGARGADRFVEGDWIELMTGAPILRGAAAAMDCRVEEILPRHTHAILIGRVVAVHRGPASPALVHWRSGFESLA